jgi:hypothetical protein
MNIVHPFEAHPQEQLFSMSLLEFNNTFIDLDSQRLEVDNERAQAEARAHVLTLGLTGLDIPGHRRIVIEPLRNRLRQPYALDISRDYDSLIAFTDELPVTQDLYIHRVFPSTMTLIKNVHVKVRMCTRAGQVSQPLVFMILSRLTECHFLTAFPVCAPPQGAERLRCTDWSTALHSPFFPRLSTDC